LRRAEQWLFFYAEAAEESQFNHAALSLVRLCQPFERAIECKEVDVERRGCSNLVVERHVMMLSSRF
jgi:hypothetical protein